MAEQVIKPQRLILLVTISMIVIVVVLLATVQNKSSSHENVLTALESKGFEWRVTDINKISPGHEEKLIRYGRDLVANTSFYLGPKGTVTAISNGMNCQNCHLDAGTKHWGNNYSAVFSTYPRFRERSGTVENIHKRINDCFERSLNAAKGLDTTSYEMQAMAAYINWVGHNVPKNIKPVGAGIKDLAFPERSTNPKNGRTVYMVHCQRCHGTNGEGALNGNGSAYLYPPLWGDNSYTTAAGLYRISRFAGYVKENMPFDAPYNARRLTEEEAWDVAAFVNSQPRPQKIYKNDYPNIAGKPVDHPFGPYADNFPESQHKYGPFEPIEKSYEKKNGSISKK